MPLIPLFPPNTPSVAERNLIDEKLLGVAVSDLSAPVADMGLQMAHPKLTACGDCKIVRAEVLSDGVLVGVAVWTSENGRIYDSIRIFDPKLRTNSRRLETK